MITPKKADQSEAGEWSLPTCSFILFVSKKTGQHTRTMLVGMVARGRSLKAFELCYIYGKLDSDSFIMEESPLDGVVYMYLCVHFYKRERESNSVCACEEHGKGRRFRCSKPWTEGAGVYVFRHPSLQVP